jgi:transaldolase
MSKLKELNQLGQSAWLDFIRRSLLTSGELTKLVGQGISGLTSNPAIFEKAIAGSTDYDADIRRLMDRDLSTQAIYEALAVEDIRMAANQLSAVYESTNARDGYVSLEVDPELAHDTKTTIAEAKRLFETVRQPNLMIKVPATAAGLPAITDLIGSGVNVNVTLIFGLENYRRVAEAFIAGLEKLSDSGPSTVGGHPIERIASVASFFVSRVDTAVDRELEKVDQPDLMGTIAIANCKLAYVEYRQIFSGSRWQRLAERGARLQRLLWASTSTKNPNYPDTLYVDHLIGPDTVNTLPPSTLERFIDHGQVSETVSNGVEEARKRTAKLAELNIDLHRITEDLQVEGVAAFVKPFKALMKSIEDKRRQLAAQ